MRVERAFLYCSQCSSSKELIFTCKQKEIVQVRAVICYLADRRKRLPGTEITTKPGYTASASHATKRGRLIVERERVLLRMNCRNVDIRRTSYYAFKEFSASMVK